ncbi:MAG: N-acetylglucosamine-6-phosphate deacetylase [Vicinamibacterales bacterium]
MPESGVVLLCGASLVLPDRVVSGATLVLRGDRIEDIVHGPRAVGEGEARVDLPGHLIVPGFVDVHVHGMMGTDVQDGDGAVATVAGHLPRRGVTAFCPTTVACDPATLAAVLGEVARLRAEPPGARARVIGAHLESNFINPDYRGAQPLACLRRATESPVSGAGPDGAPGATPATRDGEAADAESFTGRDVLAVVDRHRADVGVFTLAPEIDGGLPLVRALVAAGTRVSIGHTGATFDQAQEAIAAGVRHATHLFNRMTGLSAREPGVVGAVLASEDVAAEIICDGRHVHPASVRAAFRAKGPGRVMAITDGTAGAGLPRGSRATLGGRPITVEDVARLDDGTMAGSVLTMDRAFAMLAGPCGADLVQAAAMCATTPARELGLVGLGIIAPGAVADLAVLDSRLAVVQTWIAGKPAWNGRSGTPGARGPS